MDMAIGVPSGANLMTLAWKTNPKTVNAMAHKPQSPTALTMEPLIGSNRKRKNPTPKVAVAKKNRGKRSKHFEKTMLATIPAMPNTVSVMVMSVSGIWTMCAKYGANILDITQTVLSEYFAMIMLASIDGLTVGFSEFVDALSALGTGRGLDIHTMHEDIFNTMHHV